MGKIKKVILIFISLLTIFLFTNCENSSPEESFKGMMSNYYQFKAPDGTELPENLKPFSPFFERNSYKIKSISVDGDAAVVDVDFKIVFVGEYLSDYYAIFLPIADKNPTQTQVDKMTYDFFKKLANKNDLKFIVKNFKVKLQKKSGEWEMVNQQEFLKILYAGVDQIKML